MATEQGILQALWGEVRPAVEARSLELVRPCIALINRRKTGAALERFADILAQPPEREAAVLSELSERLLGTTVAIASDETARRRKLWAAFVARAPARWATCRLFLDRPLPDRIWLERHGRWILYRWAGTRFLGTPLATILQEASTGAISREDAMLTVSVGGVTQTNPALP
jgi:hypothetical protein